MTGVGLAAYYTNDDSRPHTPDQWIATIAVVVAIILLLAFLDGRR